MNTDDLITLVEASAEYDIPYPSLAEAARGTRGKDDDPRPRLRTKRSGATWLTTRRWMDAALAEGQIGRRRSANLAQD